MERPDLARPPPRLIVRHSLEFLLHAVRSVSRNLDGDILGGLVILALLQREYSRATHASAAIGDQDVAGAKPLSVKSLARSLKTPPETMRRSVARLIASDWCVRMPREGITLSRSEAARARIAVLMSDIRTNFLLLLSDLKRIGFDFDTMDRVADEGGDAAEDRGHPSNSRAHEQSPALDRAILNFGLRVVDAGTSPFGNDYVMTCVFTAIMSANASPIAYDPDETWRYSTNASPPPDELRRPVSLAEVSQLLGIPYETARRYVNKLIARGSCTRDERKGLLIPMDLLQRPGSQMVGMEIVGRFVQLIGELKHLGFDFGAVEPLDAADLRAGQAHAEFNRRSHA